MNERVAIMLLAGYLVGSLPFGVIVGRCIYGVDPRDVGSGNIGAANAMRALGRTGGALVLCGDILKGILPALWARHWLGDPLWIAAAGLATIVGHNWSLFLRLRGGKGVATALGVLVVLAWPAALVFAALWLLVLGLFRYSSLASLSANAAVPFALLALRAPPPYVAYAWITLALVVWRHTPNIKRLLAGNELRIGAGKEQNQAT
jgi:glycerol-3-phosphate acyltransferase PlsY